MVGADTQARKADGDIDGVVEIKQFERNERLGMVGGYHSVIQSLRGIAVHAVRYAGAGKSGIAALLAKLVYSRDNKGGFLIAEGAVFTVMRIKAGNGYAGSLCACFLLSAAL